MNDFLKKIQSGDNEEKKSRLIILSGVTMVVVIILWVFYMNTVVFKSPSETETQEVKIDFWPVFKTGASVTAGNVIAEIKEKIIYAIGEVNKLRNNE